MRFQVSIKKCGRWWCSSVAELAVHTQGRTKKDAVAMVIDAIAELSTDDIGRRLEFRDVGKCQIETADVAGALALMLRRLRVESGTSLRSLAARAAGKSAASPNSVSQCESGDHEPSLSKVAQLLAAIGKDVCLTVVDHAKN